MHRRTKYFASILYLDSVVPDWKKKLEDTHIAILVSPLHNKDIDAEGKIKKPHYHILIMFESLKSYDQAAEIINEVSGVGVEIVQSVRGYARYLIHLDNPEKAQYSENDVLELSGADYQSLIHLPQDRYSVIAEILDFCITNEIDSFAEVLIYAKDNRPEWFHVMCDNGANILINFLKSKVWTKNKYQ